VQQNPVHLRLFQCEISFYLFLYLWQALSFTYYYLCYYACRDYTKISKNSKFGTITASAARKESLMQTLFITATGTDVGKTYTTLKLIKAFSQRGIHIGLCKPVETGVIDTPVDAKALLEACQKVNPSFESLAPEAITAYTFPLPAAPFCADTQQMIDPEKILEKIEGLQSRCDLLIVEGAGGLMVPITREFMMIDLAKDLNARVLLVTPSRLGCINDTLLSFEALTSKGIDFDWCVNLYEDRKNFEKVTQPYYDAVYPEWWSAQEGLEEYAGHYC
jgi:dethiobiotin synthetase